MNKKNLETLLNNNRRWAQACTQTHPGLFESLVQRQSPPYLWIGCSDSRVAAETLLGLLPGDLFVHRNIGNLVHGIDINIQSVLQYAVASLQVTDIIVCGHSNCGAIKAAVSGGDLGVMNGWLAAIKEVYHAHAHEFDTPPTARDLDRLSRLNTIVQVENVCRSAPVRHAWENGQALSVHGLLYTVADGRLHDLDVSVNAKARFQGNDGIAGSASRD